jgi:hypothetical protein
MSDEEPRQSAGRKANAAQPPGQRPGLVSRAGVKRTGEKSRRVAGPDGPDAAEVGDTFKRYSCAKKAGSFSSAILARRQHICAASSP